MADYSLNIEQLVKRAQLGDKSCFEQLVGLAQERLRADVYRLTLEDELTAEIVQETIVEMFKVFGQLNDPQRFWPWLYKIALNKFRSQKRRERIHKAVPISSVNPASDGKDTMTTLIGEELKQAIFEAMRRLKPEHRTILTMRCYREMDYALIAESLGCSRFAAKMLFYRAKKSLAKQLSCRGFGRGSLLIALVLFGKMTAESKAAAAGLYVTAASVKVGAPIGIAGAILSTPGIITVSAIGLIGAGTVVTTYEPKEQIPAVQQQFVQVLPSADKETSQPPQQQSWYYYPQGPKGPVMIRLMKKDTQGRGSYYFLRQNEEGNYQFDEKSNTIYIRNCRAWNSDFTVRRLPTDGPQLRSFLSGIDGAIYNAKYIPYAKDGLLVIATEGSETADNPPVITYQRHLLDEEYFHYNLPVGARLVDQRDEMHKRGWTYFTITGDINGQMVRGRGRIPFVYATSRDYYPWLQLSMGDTRVIDTSRKAGLYNQNSKTTQTYPHGEFFKGLPRPWVGLHTIDIVRRDAAENGLSFETKPMSESEQAEISVISGDVRLVYTIDMQNDVVAKIDLYSSNSNLGQLVFSYMQDIDSAADFVEPTMPTDFTKRKGDAGESLWLFRLAEAKPGEELQ